ncbi:hypothetical protein N7541_002469 [Penicillium brevicompactum]|uniref:Uncharacterized protein n=1 Tax=Penicillium brevicompactum TaxID=5074 RepID=A0A9W9RJZ4_PENBR|nr:hypothetical protein N7541_002469 [Penicillium brevicompactum]
MPLPLGTAQISYPYLLLITFIIMPVKNESKEYMKLFAGKGDGNYLYKPLRYEELHPGSIGFFDEDNIWNEITDVSDPKRLQEGGFTPLRRTLKDLYLDGAEWITRSAESLSEQSYRGKAGGSGAAGAVPVEASGELKYKTGSKGKAALVADGLVKIEKYTHPFMPAIQKWVEENANKLVDECGESAREHGLVAVQAVWVTDSCAITMSSGSDRDIDTAVDVGATGFGKIGGGAAFIEKLESEGWTAYKSDAGSKGRVVSYNGLKFRPRRKTKWFSSNPFREVSITETISFGPRSTIMRPVLDDEGNIIEFELVKRVVNSENQYEFHKVPKQEEPENHETAEGEGFPVEVNEVELEGASEEDIEAERQYQEEEKQKREQEMVKEWEEFLKETETMNQQLREGTSST